MTSVRIDKWLWAVRLFKTRSLATEACRLGRVTLAGQEAKPAREVRPGDVISIQQQDYLRSVRIKAVREERMGAKLVPDFLEDITPPEELAKAQALREQRRLAAPVFDPGLGRPTKQQRRELDQFLSQVAQVNDLNREENEEGESREEEEGD